jgi:hypothetical protein
MSEELKKQQKKLTEILNLKELIPLEVVHAMVEDEEYMADILESKEDPEELKFFLDNPPMIDNPLSVIKLTTSITKAMVKWAKLNYMTVSDEEFDRRLEACDSCQYKRQGNKKGIYTIVPDVGNKNVCVKCGCVIEYKARVYTESCPFEKWERLGEDT